MPNWHLNPFAGDIMDQQRHWSMISDFSNGDIKAVWEINRFSFVYDLVRAYWRTDDEKYAECFWHLVEHWKESNQPQAGVNWKCGQEITIRLMAWLFGLYGFRLAGATTPQRLANMALMCWVSAERIEKNISYALNQRNNHGISEAAGLWTVGLLYPQFPESGRWKQTGYALLDRLGADLIYDDGSFIQHSFNYHRLMLQVYTWAIRLGDLHGIQFSKELRERIGRSCLILYQVQDNISGEVPNYGQNDGALVLPLSNSDYTDFRPAIQAAHYLLTGTRCYPKGPWDEALLWLFGPDALGAPELAPECTDLLAEDGGYYTLRSRDSFAFLRCATYRDRPGQADMLHVDLWWRGQNIACDAGTYSYNAPDPWNNSLAGTLYHNTVSVDGLSQMEQVGKFLWLPWLQSKFLYHARSKTRRLAYLEAEHNGYSRLNHSVRHRRAVLRIGSDMWVVFDTLNSAGAHQYRLHWLFPDFAHNWQADDCRLNIHTGGGEFYAHAGSSSKIASPTLVRADTHSPRGWRSLYYHSREPALSLVLAVETDSTIFWTIFSSEPAHVTTIGREVRIETIACQAVLTLTCEATEPLVQNITTYGSPEDSLLVTRYDSARNLDI